MSRARVMPHDGVQVNYMGFGYYNNNSFNFSTNITEGSQRLVGSFSRLSNRIYVVTFADDPFDGLCK